MSGVEPGPNGTMIRTVFVGHACAAAVTGANKSADKANAKLLFIDPLAAHDTIIRPLSSLAQLVPARRESHDLSNHGRGDRRKHGLAAAVVAVSRRGDAGTALPRDLPWPLLSRTQQAGAA